MNESLTENLIRLKLPYLSENLDDFLTGSAKKGESVREMLARWSELELLEQTNRRVERRIRTAKIGKFRTMNEFDWQWPKEIDRDQIDSVLKLDFIKAKANVILAGNQGLGKTMIARNIAWLAASKGYHVLFTTASKLVMDLGAIDGAANLEKRLRHYEKFNLLVVDEIGYLAFDQRSADLMFEIINRRYERSSLVLTTNLAFKDWHEIFPGSPCISAMVDRLTHHCRIIRIFGDSYRSKEAKDLKHDLSN
jgi:DNA replication protein DnaC